MLDPRSPSTTAALLVALALGLTACASGPAQAARGDRPGAIVLTTDRVIDLNDGISLAMIKAAQTKLLEYDSQSHAPVWIRMNSPGGSVDAGLILIDTMAAVKSPIHCIVESKAYSMAAIILTFCDRRYGYPHATYMLHEASYGTVGEDPSNRSKLDFLTRYLDRVHERIAANIGMDVKTYRAKIRDAWWLLSDEAKKVGLIDEIITHLEVKEHPVEKTEVKRTVTAGAELDELPATPTIPKRRD